MWTDSTDAGYKKRETKNTEHKIENNHSQNTAPEGAPIAPAEDQTERVRDELGKPQRCLNVLLHAYWASLQQHNQCCGSGSGIRCLFDPWIQDGKNQDPDPGLTNRDKYILKFFDADPSKTTKLILLDSLLQER
jgi:hypothetical protein